MSHSRRQPAAEPCRRPTTRSIPGHIWMFDGARRRRSTPQSRAAVGAVPRSPSQALTRRR
eukprot:scaffold673155_cov37-Prasinocladus_malaysianus.AAC.1